MTHHSLIRDPAVEAERRLDRHPQTPGHVVMPNGSLVASLDPAFLASAVGLAMVMYDAERRVVAVVS
jgi:hypothetical protein